MSALYFVRLLELDKAKVTEQAHTVNWKGLRKKERVTLSQSTILQYKLSW